MAMASPCGGGLAGRTLPKIPDCRAQADKLDTAMTVLTSLLSDLEQELRDHNAHITELDDATKATTTSIDSKVTTPKAGGTKRQTHEQVRPSGEAAKQQQKATPTTVNGGSNAAALTGSGTVAQHAPTSKLDTALSVLTSQLADLEDELRDHNSQVQAVDLQGGRSRGPAPRPIRQHKEAPSHAMEKDVADSVEAELGVVHAKVRELRESLGSGSIPHRQSPPVSSASECQQLRVAAEPRSEQVMAAVVPHADEVNQFEYPPSGKEFVAMEVGQAALPHPLQPAHPAPPAMQHLDQLPVWKEESGTRGESATALSNLVQSLPALANPSPSCSVASFATIPMQDSVTSSAALVAAPEQAATNLAVTAATNIGVTALGTQQFDSISALAMMALPAPIESAGSSGNASAMPRATQQAEGSQWWRERPMQDAQGTSAVQLELTMNLDYDKLVANSALVTQTKNAIRATVAKEAGPRIEERNVSVDLSKGSVKAKVTVIPPIGVEPTAVANILKTSTAIEAKVASEVTNVPGITEVASGNISVAVTSKPQLASPGNKAHAGSQPAQSQPALLYCAPPQQTDGHAASRPNYAEIEGVSGLDALATQPPQQNMLPQSLQPSEATLPPAQQQQQVRIHVSAIERVQPPGASGACASSPPGSHMSNQPAVQNHRYVTPRSDGGTPRAASRGAASRGSKGASPRNSSGHAQPQRNQSTQRAPRVSAPSVPAGVLTPAATPVLIARSQSPMPQANAPFLYSAPPQQQISPQQQPGSSLGYPRSATPMRNGQSTSASSIPVLSAPGVLAATPPTPVNDPERARHGLGPTLRRGAQGMPQTGQALPPPPQAPSSGSTSTPPPHAVGATLPAPPAISFQAPSAAFGSSSVPTPSPCTPQHGAVSSTAQAEPRGRGLGRLPSAPDAVSPPEAPNMDHLSNGSVAVGPAAALQYRAPTPVRRDVTPGGDPYPVRRDVTPGGDPWAAHAAKPMATRTPPPHAGDRVADGRVPPSNEAPWWAASSASALGANRVVPQPCTPLLVRRHDDRTSPMGTSPMGSSPMGSAGSSANYQVGPPQNPAFPLTAGASCGSTLVPTSGMQLPPPLVGTPLAPVPGLPRGRSLTPQFNFSAPASQQGSQYRGDPNDPMDMMMSWCLVSLGGEASSKLFVRRIGAGRYEIDGRPVTIRWSGNVNSTELFVREDQVEEVYEIPLRAYLSQASHVSASLSGRRDGLPAVSRIPIDKRLTFIESQSNMKGTTETALNDNTGCERVSSMRLAVEQARIREEAATAYESFGKLKPPLTAAYDSFQKLQPSSGSAGYPPWTLAL